MFVDMRREHEIVLTYIPLQEGGKTTGNMIVGDFTERNVGAETRTVVTQREGREMYKQDGNREEHSRGWCGRW